MQLEITDLIKADAKQAFGNLDDYINWKTTKMLATNAADAPVLDANDNPIYYHTTDFYLTDKDKVDMSLVKSITKGRDGLKVELKDPEKARERLYKFFANSNDGKNNETNALDKLLNTIAKGAEQDDKDKPK
ncbi:hypothetical protein IV37_GL000175 [Fructilactobacillus fructivorans]|nr:hypothetical protein IV37_GL000175 [Fructilactobacillus fructivorans]